MYIFYLLAVDLRLIRPHKIQAVLLDNTNKHKNNDLFGLCINNKIKIKI